MNRKFFIQKVKIIFTFLKNSCLIKTCSKSTKMTLKQCQEFKKKKQQHIFIAVSIIKQLTP